MNKSIILIFCFLSTYFVMISSCSDKLNQPGFPGFRCNLNGSEYIADTAYYHRSLGTAIYAYTGPTARFKFYLLTTSSGKNADSIGTYNLDTINNRAYYTDGVTTYQAISGTLTISQYYNDSLGVINGSFNMTARVPGSSGNTIGISDGYFNSIPKH